MTQLQQQIQQVFPSLPEEIKELLLSEDFNNRIEVIAMKHSLDEDQTGILIRITVRLLIGAIAPTKFVSSIIDNTEIERETASFIAQEINRDIFNPIKDALKEVHSIADKQHGETSRAERPLGTAPIVPRPLLKPDLSVLSSESGQMYTSVPPINVATPIPTPSGQVDSLPPKAQVQALSLPSFSIASALGNIPSTASTPDDTASRETPKAHVGEIAASAVSRPQSGNILEDKLGGTYRMSTEGQPLNANSEGSPLDRPLQIIPPPPQATTPAQVTPSSTDQKSALAKALDPYRESPM